MTISTDSFRLFSPLMMLADAAAHGGYSRVCAMPNLDPAPDSLQTLAPQLERIRTDAVIDVTPYGAITAHRGGTSASWS